MESLTTKTTFIKNKYHCRLMHKDEVIDEMACKYKVDIRFCIATMLRWYDKCGGISKMAQASRKRNFCAGTSIKPEGRIWYKKDLVKFNPI